MELPWARHGMKATVLNNIECLGRVWSDLHRTGLKVGKVRKATSRRLALVHKQSAGGGREGVVESA